ncbi:Uncharacterised protein [Shigella flexneri]|nr:Uncharacterised protein [Shigella flexneri]
MHLRQTRIYRLLIMCQPFDIKTIKVREIILTGVIPHANQRTNLRFNGKFAQRFQAAAQCGHSGFIADIQLIRVIFRHHQRTARTCHRKFIAQPLATPPS